MDVLNGIEHFRDMLQEIPKQYEFNQREIKRLEQERNDLMHLAEFGKYNAFEGYSYFRRLGEISQERRKIKDENELLEPIVKMIEKKNITKEKLNQLIGQCRKIMKTQEKRSYRVRVREDLQDKFTKKQRMMNGEQN